jgi:hypothetical protein
MSVIRRPEGARFARPAVVAVAAAFLLLVPATIRLVPQARASQGPLTFTSTAALTLFDGNFTTPEAASPYPSTIAVSGFSEPGAVINRISVGIVGLTHKRPHDLDFMLVAPDGTKSVIMSDAGGPDEVANLSLALDDTAATALPDEAPLTNGATYRPGNLDGADTFPAPAPDPAGAASTLGVFRGHVPNGTWSLYVEPVRRRRHLQRHRERLANGLEPDDREQPAARYRRQPRAGDLHRRWPPGPRATGGNRN